jgi:ribulose-phosphate 3-epimerase
MDGHFVPNITVGPMVVKALRPLVEKAGVPLDVHLMIEKPEHMIPSFAQAGAHRITVHVETCPHLHRTIEQIRELGAMPGVTLNPATPLATLEEILPEVDLVLLMSVNPGFGGQEYIPASTRRISGVRKMLDALHLDHVELEVDGGIKEENVAEIVQAGASVLVIGSGVFNQQRGVAENIASIRSRLF